MIAHGGGQVTGAQRFPLKGRQYYNQEKAEEAAADWVDAAQMQADGLGESMSVFVALWESTQGVGREPAEQSAPWRVETAVPRGDTYVPTEKGTLALLAKIVQDQARIITHAMPQIANQAIQFSQVQHERALALEERQESARILREDALSQKHDREMEREKAAREQANYEQMLSFLKTLWPVMHKAIATRLTGGPPQLAGNNAAAATQQQAPSRRPHRRVIKAQASRSSGRSSTKKRSSSWQPRSAPHSAWISS